VFCDLSMPRLDGFGVLGLVRRSSDERIRNLPVIVISGDEDESTRRRARECGATDFISKNADATVVLSRIDNQLRLLRAKAEASDSREAAAQTSTHDPLTGALSLHFLLTEGRKQYAYARRHGSPLAVTTFRIDSHHPIAAREGKEVAEQLLAKIARAIQQVLRAEDSLGRSGEDAFTVILFNTAGEQAAAFARRMREQLVGARIRFQGRTLGIQASIGLAALGADSAASVEDLMRLASSRLSPAEARAAAPARAPGLPPEVERALQVLERIPADRMGNAAAEIARRLEPVLRAARKRPRGEAAAEAVVKALQRAK
jgi:two-component system cell cycle response regulator